MNDAIKQRILNALLDKYERSSFFIDEKQPTRRILLNFYNRGKSDFPYYDIEQSERRIAVNRSVIELSELEILFFEWMRGEEDHIVSQIWLNIDNISFAYRITKREPKGETVDNVLAEIEAAKRRTKSEWTRAFLRDAYEEINRKRSITRILPTDRGERETFLSAVAAIDELDGSEFTERVFSLRTFGDSKKFERSARSRILSALRKYLDIDDDVIDEDILKQVGIVKYPEQFEFCGKLSVALASGIVDFSCLPSGGIIYSTDLTSGCIHIGSSIESVVTIENRANYIDYIQNVKTENELVIYHGGQYSPRKRAFMQAVAGALPPHCKWRHWSDIDYGGFIMLSRIRRDVISNAEPYRMNVDELKRHQRFSAPITRQYAEKIRGLKTRPELLDCCDCMDYMLENMIRLEQEAMLVEDIRC
ncbi:MAG: DUF2220 domain-containing protein [Clostridiales Family XIII bacterium]|jgi:hypothetical protein|nr:DUF2220 domain-containing protein [Clostridiales Family XIII bacterium]